MKIDNPSKRKRDPNAEYSVEWYTPADIVKGMVGIMEDVYGDPRGPWIDPCTSAAARAYQDAEGVRPPEAFATAEDSWGFENWPHHPAFVNPPYGKGIDAWLAACAHHPNLAIALVPASPDTNWWQDAAAHAACFAFTRQRLGFIDGATGEPVKNNTKGSTFFFFGARATRQGVLFERWAKARGYFLGGGV